MSLLEGFAFDDSWQVNWSCFFSFTMQIEHIAKMKIKFFDDFFLKYVPKKHFPYAYTYSLRVQTKKKTFKFFSFFPLHPMRDHCGPHTHLFNVVKLFKYIYVLLLTDFTIQIFKQNVWISLWPTVQPEIIYLLR